MQNGARVQINWLETIEDLDTSAILWRTPISANCAEVDCPLRILPGNYAG